MSASHISYEVSVMQYLNIYAVMIMSHLHITQYICGTACTKVKNSDTNKDVINVEISGYYISLKYLIDYLNM